MDYANDRDMLARFKREELVALTDHENNAALDVGRIKRALADAQTVIDGRIGMVYRLPLTGCAKPPVRKGVAAQYVPPPQLTRIACDIARYYLHDDLAPEHEVYRRYKDAIAQLDAIASGNAQLACPWGGSPGELLTSDAQSGQDVRYRFSPRAVTDAEAESYK